MLLYHCKKCKFVKAETEFYVSNSTVCKSCVRDRVNANRAANIERVRAYDRARGNRQPSTYGREYKSKFPHKRKAQIALNNAVRDGRVQAWPVCALPECAEHPEAHHADYSSPLSVVWLCPAHHKQTHAMAKRLA